MNFTQEQISDLLFDLASEKGGTHLLLNLTLDAFMKAERSLHQKENSGEYAFFYWKREFFLFSVVPYLHVV